MNDANTAFRCYRLRSSIRTLGNRFDGGCGSFRSSSGRFAVFNQPIERQNDVSDQPNAPDINANEDEATQASRNLQTYWGVIREVNKQQDSGSSSNQNEGANPHYQAARPIKCRPWVLNSSPHCQTQSYQSVCGFQNNLQPDNTDTGSTFLRSHLRAHVSSACRCILPRIQGTHVACRLVWLASCVRSWI